MSCAQRIAQCTRSRDCKGNVWDGAGGNRGLCLSQSALLGISGQGVPLLLSHSHTLRLVTPRIRLKLSVPSPPTLRSVSACMPLLLLTGGRQRAYRRFIHAIADLMPCMPYTVSQCRTEWTPNPVDLKIYVYDLPETVSYLHYRHDLG